jgi:CubicO group peptidase (beta-lactamase class C family)
VDDLITNRMREHHITGLSLAIIQDGKIIKAKGYGFTDKSRQTPVTPGTLFQAGSISKAVAALGALHLVQEGRLSLDNDVNAYLHTWKVPANALTKEQKVTLRRILSHTAGLTVHGFSGYGTNDPVPALLEVLDGARPANNQAVRVDIVPGSKWRYSGGGYTVMQQMIVDVTGKPFPEFMSDTLLKPLAMTNSTYEQPLPQRMAASAAAGYLKNGGAVMGGWRVQPELAAAGLWTTPSDLARFALGIQQALAGDSNAILSQANTRLMLTNQKDGDGLGVFVDGSGQALRFSHGGRNAGFDSFMIAYASVGKGAVIMMNANDSWTSRAIVNAIAKEYGWTGGIPLIPPAWQRHELLHAVMVTHPNVARGAVLVFCGLALIAVVASRRILKRHWRGR